MCSSDLDIRRLVRRGILSPQAWGVYVAAAHTQATNSPARDKAVQLAAYLARSRTGTVGSHHTAALIHGIALLGPAPDQEITLTRPPGTTGSRTGTPGVLVHAASLPGRHVTNSPGVPITTAVRTVVDLARMSSFVAGVVAADSALRSKLATKADMQSIVTDCARWPGIRMARRVVEFSDERSESVLESIARVAFHEHGLPPPDLQVWSGTTKPLAESISCGGSTGQLARRMVLSSTPILPAPLLSYGGTLGCGEQASSRPFFVARDP